MSVPVAMRAAFAVGQVAKKNFTQNFVQQVPLLAVLKPVLRGGAVHGNEMEVPLVYTGPQNMNLGTIGVADANEIPSAWPSYPQTQGFTMAKYQWTHWQHIMTLKESEMKLLAGGSLRTQGILQSKVAQMQMAWTAIMDENLSSVYQDSRLTLMGIPFMVSASNTVGQISQSTNAWWQSDVSTMSTASLSTISALLDRLTDKASINPATLGKDSPDVFIMAAPEGAFDIFAQVRQLIQPSERIVNNNGGKAKYGFKTYEYAGLTCVRGNRLPAGTSYMLNTGNIHFIGDDAPRKDDTQRIPGSTATETPYTWWGALGTDSCRSHGGFTGTTA